MKSALFFAYLFYSISVHYIRQIVSFLPSSSFWVSSSWVSFSWVSSFLKFEGKIVPHEKGNKQTELHKEHIWLLS